MYADAAEARGSWDSTGWSPASWTPSSRRHRPELLSRAAALNWDTTAPGDCAGRHAAAGAEELASEDLREIALRHEPAALADVHGTWLIAIISGPLSPTDKFFNDLLTAFSSGPVVMGRPRRCSPRPITAPARRYRA